MMVTESENLRRNKAQKKNKQIETDIQKTRMPTISYHTQSVHRDKRELKMETFLGRRRPDWQRKPGTKAAVAPRQK